MTPKQAAVVEMNNLLGLLGRPALSEARVRKMSLSLINENIEMFKGELAGKGRDGAAPVNQNEFYPEPAPAEEALPTEASDEDEADPEVVQDYLNGQFALMFMNAGGNGKRATCRALRAVARAWEGSRKEFIEAAAAAGLNATNAAAEWQASKHRAD